MTNRLKEVRENLLISRAELARKAGVCFLTITRVEKGLPCRGETKRKILAGLGLKPSQRDMVFSSTHPPKKELNFALESHTTVKDKDVDRAAF